MPEIVRWGVPLVLFALFAFVDLVVLAGGAYQVFTGRSVLLFVGFHPRAVPAAAADAALEGAARVVQAVGLFLIVAPTIVPFVSATVLLTGSQMRPLDNPPLVTAVADAAYGLDLACLLIAVFCIGVSLALGMRVRYIDQRDGRVASGLDRFTWFPGSSGPPPSE